MFVGDPTIESCICMDAYLKTLSICFSRYALGCCTVFLPHTLAADIPLSTGIHIMPRVLHSAHSQSVYMCVVYDCVLLVIKLGGVL